MSRKKKRYNKVSSEKQAPTKPQVSPPEPVEVDENITRYKAVVRSPAGEWWFENKRRVRIIAIVLGVGLIVGWLLFELFSMIF